MKKIAFLALGMVFIPATLFAQEKVEAPVWNAGDKWGFSGRGTIEVLKMEKDGYVVRFSDSTCIIESQGFKTILFDKTNFKRIHWVKGDKRKKYTMGLKRIFSFPYTIGKQWKDAYCAAPLVGQAKGQISLDYYEKFKVLGWEEISVKAGKFRTLKIEAIRGHEPMPQRWVPGMEYKGFYWYSPEAKYFVKCQYDPASVKEFQGEVVNWELTSFQLKK
jgi:hypothetical protein